jgi:hypothetical protein
MVALNSVPTRHPNSNFTNFSGARCADFKKMDVYFIY